MTQDDDNSTPIPLFNSGWGGEFGELDDETKGRSTDNYISGRAFTVTVQIVLFQLIGGVVIGISFSVGGIAFLLTALVVSIGLVYVAAYFLLVEVKRMIENEISEV